MTIVVQHYLAESSNYFPSTLGSLVKLFLPPLKHEQKEVIFTQKTW